MSERRNSMTAITMNLNAEKNGVEIKFPEKPIDAIRDKMKALKFKWNPTFGIWYAKQSDETIALAKEICGEAEAKPKTTTNSKAKKATAKSVNGTKCTEKEVQKPKKAKAKAELAVPVEDKVEAPAKPKKETKKTKATKKADKAVAEATAFPDFHRMSEAEIAETITKAVGVPFIYDKNNNEYVYSIKNGKFKMSFGLSHYSCDGYNGSHKKGDAFISAGYQKNYGNYFGCQCPCNSIDSAVRRLKEGKEYMAKNVA